MSITVTVRQLHANRGNPDLTHWRNQKLFSVEEVALLTCGFDPLDYLGVCSGDLSNELRITKPTNWQHVLMLMRAICQAICTQEIKSPCIYIDHGEYNGESYQEKKEQIELSSENWKDLHLKLTNITRTEIFKWLALNQYLDDTGNAFAVLSTGALVRKPKPQFNYHQDIPGQVIDNSNFKALPAPNYSTPALECLNAVIVEFWAGYDPGSNMPPPKQETVISWIKTNHPDISAKQIQEAIDKICRHPSAKTGGVKPLRKFKDITPQNH